MQGRHHVTVSCLLAAVPLAKNENNQGLTTLNCTGIVVRLMSSGEGDA